MEALVTQHSAWRIALHMARGLSCRVVQQGSSQLNTQSCVLVARNRPVWQLNTSKVAMAELRAKEARDAELLNLDALERHSCATLE
jgi:hypothetical protein